MALGDVLMDTTYKPPVVQPYIDEVKVHKNVVKCPVKFTEDPLEFITGSDFLGAKLRPIQKTIVEDLFTDLESPDYNEAVIICGMRGGKSAIAAFISAYMNQWALSFEDPSEFFGVIKGQKISTQFVANSGEQANKTAYAAFDSIVDNYEWFQKYIGYLKDREDAGEGKQRLFHKTTKKVDFKEKNIIIKSLHSNSNSLAGETSLLVVFDELSRFKVSGKDIQTSSESSSAQAVYNTSSRAAKTLKPYSRIVTVTSPMYENDYGMQLLYKAGTLKAGAGKSTIETLRDKEPTKDKSMIGYHYSTFEMNPKTPTNPKGFEEADFIKERAQSPLAYQRDYLAIPPSAVNPFFEHPEFVDRCEYRPEVEKVKVVFTDKIIEDTTFTRMGPETRKYVGKICNIIKPDLYKKYVICCDQGHKKDNFVISMGHIEEIKKEYENAKGKKEERVDYKIVVDFVEGWVPDKLNKLSVSFKNVEEVVEILCQSFNVQKVLYDQWQSVESMERLFSKGIHTDQIGATFKMYEEFKGLIYQNRVEFPYHDKLGVEVKQLNQIHTGSTIKIDHPTTGSKDYADSVCRTVYSLYIDYLVDIIEGSMMTGQTQFMPSDRGAGIFGAGTSEYNENSIWGASPSGNSQSIFGESFFVKRNITRNV